MQRTMLRYAIGKIDAQRLLYGSDSHTNEIHLRRCIVAARALLMDGS